MSTGPTSKSSDYDADKNLHKNDQTNQLDKWNMNKHELHKKIKFHLKQNIGKCYLFAVELLKTQTKCLIHSNKLLFTWNET